MRYVVVVLIIVHSRLVMTSHILEGDNRTIRLPHTETPRPFTPLYSTCQCFKTGARVCVRAYVCARVSAPTAAPPRLFSTYRNGTCLYIRLIGVISTRHSTWHLRPEGRWTLLIFMQF